MALADDLAAPPADGPRIDVILAELDGDDAAALRAALLDRRFTHAHLVRVLKANGYDIGETTIRRWRANNCG